MIKSLVLRFTKSWSLSEEQAREMIANAYARAHVELEQAVIRAVDPQSGINVRNQGYQRHKENAINTMRRNGVVNGAITDSLEYELQMDAYDVINIAADRGLEEYVDLISIEDAVDAYQAQFAQEVRMVLDKLQRA